MQPIAVVLVVAVHFVAVNIITPAFTTVRWSTLEAMGWTSRVLCFEATQFLSSLSRRDLM